MLQYNRLTGGIVRDDVEVLGGGGGGTGDVRRDSGCVAVGGGAGWGRPLIFIV